MYPTFPEFKKISLADKIIIESFTEKFAPYSDFNFISLYCWNTDTNTLFSFLHGNLVICMKDYTSDDTIYSFLGNNQIHETIKELLVYASQTGTNQLSLIPHEAINNLPQDLKKYTIEEERDHFDYIYNLEELANMNGGNYMSQRNKYKLFEKNYESELRIIDAGTQKNESEILQLCAEWKDQKIKEKKYYDESEFTAIRNYLSINFTEKNINFGLYINNKLVGFSFFEVTNNDYCVFHFEKTNHSLRGITEYLKKNTAQKLAERGLKFLNAEQDMGIEGLRKSKEQWNPATFLKKYTISK